MRLMDSYKNALIGYVAVIAILFSGFWSFVVAPHRQGLEMGGGHSRVCPSASRKQEIQ